MKSLSEHEDKIERAIDLGIRYGQIDGSHHKMWVIDQMMRILTGSEYEKIIKENSLPKEGDDEDAVYEWDCGIAP